MQSAPRKAVEGVAPADVFEGWQGDRLWLSLGYGSMPTSSVTQSGYCYCAATMHRYNQLCEKHEMVLGIAYQPPQRRPMDLAYHHMETI